MRVTPTQRSRVGIYVSGMGLLLPSSTLVHCLIWRKLQGTPAKTDHWPRWRLTHSTTCAHAITLHLQVLSSTAAWFVAFRMCLGEGDRDAIPPYPAPRDHGFTVPCVSAFSSFSGCVATAGVVDTYNGKKKQKSVFILHENSVVYRLLVHRR